ncbi:hypothetical protein QE152_g30454 [Popillia japonica]|uniref:Uncharacterized protein n=1 Tax=Popillia japonica TaxID=7064 RepID=A0AAW1JEE9_POPJA
MTIIIRITSSIVKLEILIKIFGTKLMQNLRVCGLYNKIDSYGRAKHKHNTRLIRAETAKLYKIRKYKRYSITRRRRLQIDLCSDGKLHGVTFVCVLVANIQLLCAEQLSKENWGINNRRPSLRTYSSMPSTLTVTVAK